MKKILLSGLGLLSFSAAFSQTTFNYTGATQMYIVPACVNRLSIQASGAQGNPGNPGGNAGLGGSAQGELNVSPGDTLYITVGGQNGYNGGGAAGMGGPTLSGNGGGASDVCLNGTLAANIRLVAAGGGGGTGAPQGSCGNSGGGDGGNGDTTGVTGTTGPGCGPGGTGGLGGTQTAGGNGGNGNYNCSVFSGVGSSGTFMQGGDGGVGIIGCGGYTGSGGGGGGGGYYGGGGGAGGAGGGGGAWSGGGGGGGASYIDASLLNRLSTAGTQSGDGVVVITEIIALDAPASVSGLNVACEYDTATLTAAPSVGATSYTWTVPTGFSILSGQGTNTILIQFGNTADSVSVIATNSCISSPPYFYTVTGRVRPSVTASAASGAVCAGNSDLLTASGATDYVWSSGGTDTTETVLPATSITYSVIGTDTNGCSDTAFVFVTVNPLPLITASADAGTICDGTSDTLVANGGIAYSWSNSVNTASQVVSPNSTSTYSVTGVDINGCTATATVTVVVNTLPDITITADALSICNGSSDTLTANGGITYSWSNSVTSASQAVAPSSTTTYSVTGTDMNGCAGTASVTITVNPLPTVTGTASSTSLCTTDANSTLTGAPAGGTWSGTGVSGNSFSPSTAGIGTFSLNYSYTDANGCSASSPLSMTVNACVGIEEQTANGGIAIYPNPNNGQFMFFAPAEGTLQVFNSTGQLIYNAQVLSGNNPLLLGTADNGVYFIRYSDGQSIRESKMIIQK